MKTKLTYNLDLAIGSIASVLCAGALLALNKAHVLPLGHIEEMLDELDVDQLDHVLRRLDPGDRLADCVGEKLVHEWSRQLTEKDTRIAELELLLKEWERLA